MEWAADTKAQDAVLKNLLCLKSQVVQFSSGEMNGYTSWTVELDA